MPMLTLENLDHGLRRQLTEPEWATAVALSGDVVPPDWAAPIADPDDPADVELDPALREAVRLRGTALVEVEVTAVAGDRGVHGVLWTDGRVGAGIVRGLDIGPQGSGQAARPRPGIEVSAFPLSRYVAEVLRLVPPAHRAVEASEVTIPAELTIALAHALRRGDGQVIEAVCADLHLERVPPVIDAVVRTMDGTVIVEARSAGRDDVTVASWLRCSAGWVDLSRTVDEQIRHTPRTVDDLGDLLVFDLAGRLDVALGRPRPGGPDGGEPS